MKKIIENSLNLDIRNISSFNRESRTYLEVIEVPDYVEDVMIYEAVGWTKTPKQGVFISFKAGIEASKKTVTFV